MAHIQLISFVEPVSEDNKIWKFSYSYPVIISELQKTRHSYELVDTHLHKKTKSEIIDFLKNCSAKIYGISAYSEGYKFTKRIAEVIRKKHPDSVIIVGGMLAVTDEVLLRNSETNIAVHSPDGEFILPQILDAVDENNTDLSHISGISYKDKKTQRVIRNVPRPLMTQEEFIKTERPAYEFFDNEIEEIVANLNQLTDQPVRGFPHLSQRGCPFACTFCGHRYGKKVLRKSWKDLFEELEFLQQRYGMEGFFGMDSNLFLNEKDAYDFCKMYKERNATFLIVPEIRPTFGDYNMFKTLKECGAPVIRFGFESGCQAMLDRMKKGTRVEQIRQVIDAALAADVIVFGAFCFGTLGENKKTVSMTKNFIVDQEKKYEEQAQKFKKEGLVSTSGYTWSILVAAPPSELYQYAVQKGYINDLDKYLESLDKGDFDWEFYRYHSRHFGSDVNLSEFATKDELRAYVMYCLDLVKLRRLIHRKSLLKIQDKEYLSTLRDIIKQTFVVSKQYAKYAGLYLRKNNIIFSRQVSIKKQQTKECVE